MTTLVLEKQESCQMCGKEYIRRFTYQKYCGSATRKTGCAYIADKDKTRRANRNRTIDYSKLKRIKTRIRERDDFTCGKCKTKDDSLGFMDVDHIDGNRDNNSESNLMTICPNCHRRKTIANGEYKQRGNLSATVAASPSPNR